MRATNVCAGDKARGPVPEREIPGRNRGGWVVTKKRRERTGSRALDELAALAAEIRHREQEAASATSRGRAPEDRDAHGDAAVRPSFAALVDGARPLGGKVGRVAPQRRPATSTAQNTRAGADVGPAPAFELFVEEGWVEGRRADLPAASASRLRRADAQATLDLHGLSEADAHRALLAFVTRARARGALLVLVVHGKGRHSPAGEGVLGRAVVQSLTGADLGPLVRCFTTADRSRGGTGALVVLLERLGAPSERR